MLKAADKRHRLQSRASLAAQRQARNAWRGVSVDALDSWSPARLAGQVAALQYAVARDADTYVTTALTEQDIDPAGAGRVNPAAFIGVAGDGRSLVTLLDEPRIQAKTAIGQGKAPVEAWEAASASLARMAITAVQDAARVSAGVATTARRHTAGQVRQLNPPSCSRCAILAGRWYRWDAGFPRHVNCDCIGIPVSEDVANDLTTDPMQAFRSGNVTGLSRADTQALNDGADFSRVVNIRRGGIDTAGGRKITHELRSARHGGIRLTPEQIYRDATDRADALRLLERFGYII